MFTPPNIPVGRSLSCATRYAHRNFGAMQQPGTEKPIIGWQQAVAILEATTAAGVPIPFSITFCTADVARKTGGDIITYDRAIWHVAGGKRKPETGKTSPKPAPDSGGKAPNHHANWTRNIRGLDTDQIRKLHIHLILRINGHRVR